MNINGKRVKQSGYITDILTTHALDWLQQKRSKPFCLYLSYKAVHYPFRPAPRHVGRYEKSPIKYPETMANTEANYATQPHWVRTRRYGIHGIDHMETGPFDHDPVPSLDDLFRRYCENVHGLDENIGRVLDWLDQSGLADSSLVLYMGDNGFALGEHGFYDKRDAYETSIRVPMLAYAPGLIKPQTQIDQMVQNIDVAPTLLDAAGLPQPTDPTMDGRSFLPLLQGEDDDVARSHPVRIPLGMELPGDAHTVRHSHRSVQVHLPSRALGPGCLLRPARPIRSNGIT